MKPELHDLMVISCKTIFGNEVRCYNAERTICDLIKSRNKIDVETLTAAIKNYAASKGKNVALLGAYAGKLKEAVLLCKNAGIRNSCRCSVATVGNGCFFLDNVFFDLTNVIKLVVIL